MSSFLIASTGLIPAGDAFVLRAMAVTAILGWLASSVLVSLYARKIGLAVAADPASEQRVDYIYDRIFIASTQIATLLQLVGGILILAGLNGLLAIALGMLLGSVGGNSSLTGPIALYEIAYAEAPFMRSNRRRRSMKCRLCNSPPDLLDRQPLPRNRSGDRTGRH
jgi:hypothetical protein